MAINAIINRIIIPPFERNFEFMKIQRLISTHFSRMLLEHVRMIKKWLTSSGKRCPARFLASVNQTATYIPPSIADFMGFGARRLI